MWFYGAQGFVKSKSMVEWSTSEVVPSRRSSRNFGVKRRAWHHLLRANPDEYDPTMTGQNSTASSPSKEQAHPRNKLPKSCSAKIFDDSLKSDLSSVSHEASLSQPTKLSQKGVVFDRKRSHKKLSTDPVESSKKACLTSVSRPVKQEDSVSSTMPSHAGITYRFTENGLVHSDHEPPADLSFLSYRLYNIPSLSAPNLHFTCCPCRIGFSSTSSNVKFVRINCDG